jgi:hypothetical protein
MRLHRLRATAKPDLRYFNFTFGSVKGVRNIAEGKTASNFDPILQGSMVATSAGSQHTAGYRLKELPWTRPSFALVLPTGSFLLFQTAGFDFLPGHLRTR